MALKEQLVSWKENLLFIDQLDKYNNIKDVSQQHSVFCLNGRENSIKNFCFIGIFLHMKNQ